jgi:hypothetical protein
LIAVSVNQVTTNSRTKNASDDRADPSRRRVGHDLLGQPLRVSGSELCLLDSAHGDPAPPRVVRVDVPTTTVTMQKRQLGNELRRLRDAAGLRPDQQAAPHRPRPGRVTYLHPRSGAPGAATQR